MFKNRKEAAIELARALEIYKNEDPLILAIPRGGVEIGYYIAKELECKWSVIIARKLGYPGQPETAFGAIAEDRSLFFNPRIRSQLTQNMIEEIIYKEEREIKRRIQIYRKGGLFPEIRGRTIIITDDGIATGATLFAIIEMCKKAGADKIIVAAPVSGPEIPELLLDIVYDVVILETPENFYAVSQAYEYFENLGDKEVLGFIERSKFKKESLKLQKA
ncbi:MAG: phosphoribosyltransferase family protein [Gracilimonas sp.]|nr:phosphoribosyltransferase family protein [Gracilimonas sp.]